MTMIDKELPTTDAKNVFNLKNISHIAIKCSNLSKTIKFYCVVLGLIPIERPPFGYPGAWLANHEKNPIIHLYGGRQGLASNGNPFTDTGSIDHVSIMCEGFTELLSRLTSNHIDWREFRVPNTDLYQVFCYDPNGVLLELTFLSSRERLSERNYLEKKYIAGESF